MILAVVIDLIAKLRDRHTVLAFLVRLVTLLALVLDFFQKMLKAVMLQLTQQVTLGVCTIHAFLIRWMVAFRLYLLYCVLRDSQTVHALSIRTMRAM